MIGDIIYAPFPYIEGRGSKRRPAVVLMESSGRLICAAVTSRQGGRGSLIVKINNWQDAGLKKPSLVKVDTISTFWADGVHKVGCLKKRDSTRVIRTFKRLLNTNRKGWIR